MMNADIIEPSKCSYAAPVFLIPKKQKGEYWIMEFEKLLYGNYEISGSKQIKKK